MDHDWAYFKKYATANKNVCSNKNDGNRIVFMGDSITEFWKQKDPQFFSENRNINRGIKGQTTTQIAFRFENDVVQLSPKKVVILAGINDIAENNGPISLDEIVTNFRSMVERALANNINVILCSLLPAHRIPWNPALHPVTKVGALNNRLRKIAEVYPIHYVDYFSNMVDQSSGLPYEYSHDGVHPNETGYLKMKSILEPFL